MTRTIDIPTYQTAVVRNCSPTLAGIKPASLFTYPGVYANQNGKPGAAHIEERRSRLLAVIAQCNRELQPLGIHMSVLVWRPCGALIYVYRPADLMRYLSDPRATTALAAEGYDVHNLPASLVHLAARITLASSNAAESAYDGSVCALARNRHCDTGCMCEFPTKLAIFWAIPTKMSISLSSSTVKTIRSLAHGRYTQTLSRRSRPSIPIVHARNTLPTSINRAAPWNNLSRQPDRAYKTRPHAAQPKGKHMSKIAVVYWSGTGNTEAMANFVAEGATGAGAEAEVISCADFSADKAASYDAIAFGCPAMGSEELEYDEFQPMWDEVKETLGDKKVVLFGSYSWAEGEWMDNWKADADEAGVNVVDSVICYDAPDDEGETACKALGAELA